MPSCKFSSFFATSITYFCFLSSLRQIYNLGLFFGFCKMLRFNCIYTYTKMCTHADTCKHLLCVHNAAKYILDCFGPLKNPLLNCMPFPWDAKFPHSTLVAFEGCYLFFLIIILSLQLIYENINKTATSYCSCICTSWFKLPQPSGFRIW